MESMDVPERIHLSDDTYKRLINREQYIFEERGEIDIRGKDLMRTYFFIGSKINSKWNKTTYKYSDSYRNMNLYSVML